MEPDLRRIAVLSAGVGAGHVRAGQAMVVALAEVLPHASVEKQDVLEHSGVGFRTMYRDAYVTLASRSPRLVGWLYDRADEPWQNRWYAGLVERFALRHWMRELLRRPPDVAVCTHFLPAALICHLRRRHGLPTQLVTVVTDLDVHGLWLDGRSDHWCVAGEEARQIMIEAGVAPQTVHVTGIPIADVFRNLPTRAEARRHLGVPDERPLVLFSTGGCCLGPVERTFASLLPLRDIACVVAICGNNDVARQRLQTVVPPDAQSRVRVLGFTQEMHIWMAAADLLVGKPGGLTSSEARASGLPMAVIHPIPGQEERNLAHLLEWGAAIACHTPATLHWRVRQLLLDAPRLARMRLAAQVSARPMAARHAADVVAGLDRSQPVRQMKRAAVARTAARFCFANRRVRPDGDVRRPAPQGR